MRKVLKLFSGIALVLVFSICTVMTLSGVKASTRNVYLVWNDNDGNFHYHKLTGIHRTDEGSDTINYLSTADLADDNAASVKYAIGQECDFVAEDVFEATLSNAEFTGAANKLEWLRENNKAIEPTGGAYRTANMFTSTYDMDFKVAIYNENTVIATIGTVGDALEPDFISGLFVNPMADISSGTSAAKPAILKSYLLNDTVTLNGSALTGQLATVTALDVPVGAVDVLKEGNAFVIKFNSNFYDRVVFKVTTANNKTAYLMIARIAFSLNWAENAGPGQDRSVRPTLYYKATNSYQDWQLIANITYKNGKKEVRVLNPVVEGKNDLNTDPFTNEMGGDEENKIATGSYKVKKCQFLFPDAKDMQEIKMTVIKKGALTADTYTGTFTGSGDGLVYRNVTLPGRGTTKQVIYYEGQEVFN